MVYSGFMVRKLNWNTERRFTYKKPVTIADRITALLQERGAMTVAELRTALPDVHAPSITQTVYLSLKRKDFSVADKVVNASTGCAEMRIALTPAQACALAA